MEINTRQLIYNLPIFYKEADTYKVADKGILERFLEICGDYITDQILPDIENILDKIDVDTADDEYLNQLWEFLGSFVYAKPVNYKTEVYKALHNPLDDAQTVTGKETLWTIDNSLQPITLTREQVKDVLRYAIPLLHIRGSLSFFEALFYIYGMDVTVIPKEYDKVESDEDPLYASYGYGDIDTGNMVQTVSDMDLHYDTSTLDKTLTEVVSTDVIFRMLPDNV